MKVTDVPRTPDFVCGVVNVRGNIKVLLDVGTFFGIESRNDASGKVLFVKSNGVEAGLISDVIEGVRTLEEEPIHPPPPTVANVSSRWIDGVYNTEDSPLIILDIPEILTSERIENL